jgi:hypothetical protein
VLIQQAVRTARRRERVVRALQRKQLRGLLTQLQVQAGDGAVSG